MIPLFMDDSLALFIQVRHREQMIALPRLESLLSKMMENKSHATWQSLNYKKIALRRIELPNGDSVIKVALARIDDWLVITFDEGIIHKIIDTYHGDSPSLAAHPAFARAMRGFPEDAKGLVCLNGQSSLSLLKQIDANVANQLHDSALGHLFLAGAIREKGGKVLFDGSICTTAPDMQRMLKKLRADAGVISGASLAQMPPGTFVTILLNNPEKWVGAIESFLLDASGTDRIKRQLLQQGFQQIDEQRKLLKRCIGETGLSLCWRKGVGLGIIMASQTDSAVNATAVATGFNNLLKKERQTFHHTKSLYYIPATKDRDAIWSPVSCWTTRKQWFIIGSRPYWILQQPVSLMGVPSLKPILLSILIFTVLLFRLTVICRGCPVYSTVAPSHSAM